MPRDLTLAALLRADNIPTKEVTGWKTRGSDTFHPKAFVRHHTAGPATGMTPCLNVCVNGRPPPNALDGPLCNLYLGRDKFVYVVAAGRANHAGLPDGGDWHGCKGNSDAYGIEIEHTGTTRLDPELHELAARAVAAICRGRIGQAMVCDHKEWAPSRKIDLATGPSAQEFRNRVGFFMANPYKPKVTFKLLDGEGKVLATSLKVEGGGKAEADRFKAFLATHDGAMLKELRSDSDAVLRRSRVS